MLKLLKGIVGLVFIAAVILVGYYGTYLPMRKSQLAIGGAQNLKYASSIEDVKKILSPGLDASSPIGQEEVVRSVGYMIMQNLDKIVDNPIAISDLVEFMDNYFAPIVSRRQGMSFGQNLYVLGLINGIAYKKTGEARYLAASKKYNELARELGPKRPQPLYNLFDIYRIEGNIEVAREVGEQILEQWPNDERIRRELEALGK